MNKLAVGNFSFLAVLAFLASGCGTSPVIHQGAAQGVRMTTELRGELNYLRNAQDNLYEERLKAAVASIIENYSDRQEFKLSQEIQAFALSNANADAAMIGRKIPGFMTSSMAAWSGRHEDYEKLLTKARNTHDQNRQIVQLDESKLKALRVKFVALSESRSRADAVRFLVAFTKEVKTEFDKQKMAAEDAAEDSTEAAPETDK
jgi:hypothetical protein